MLIPNAENAIVDIGKLINYLLSPEHVRGKHKSRLFAAALDLSAKDAEALREGLLAAAKKNEAIYGKFDRYGQRFTVDFSFEWRGKSAIIRSGWIEGRTYESIGIEPEQMMVLKYEPATIAA